MTGITVYIVYGILAVLLVLILVFGFGVLFLGRDQTAAQKPVVEETPVKTGFFAGQEASPASLATGKARLDSDRSGGNFLTEELRSRNSLPPRQQDDDEFKL